MYYRAREDVYRRLRVEAGLGMPGEKEEEGGKVVEVGEEEGGAEGSARAGGGEAEKREE